MNKNRTQTQTYHCFKCGRSGSALDPVVHCQAAVTLRRGGDICQCLNIELPTLPTPTNANRDEEPLATYAKDRKTP